jgi:hypothetical protein
MSWNLSTSTIMGAPTGPVDIYRANAWGTPSQDADGNSNSFTANNTDIIAINHSLLGLLLLGDVRKNYILTGTTWGDPNDPSSQSGTYKMSNTTMETFKQPSNCFACHNGNMLGTPDGEGLSHIYGPLRAVRPR